MSEIVERIGVSEVLAQMAEEATELAQASLKMRRVLDGTNPTPVTAEEAWANLLEEMADLKNCTNELFDDWDDLKITRITRAKHNRWLKRLEENKHD